LEFPVDMLVVKNERKKRKGMGFIDICEERGSGLSVT
jgi:hypothetical protein